MINVLYVSYIYYNTYIIYTDEHLSSHTKCACPIDLLRNISNVAFEHYPHKV